MVTLLAHQAWASTSSKQIQVDLTPNGTDVNASDIQVKWLFAAGDVIEKSVDGQTWQVVSPVTAGEEDPAGTIPPAGTGPLLPVPGGSDSCNRCHDLTCTSCHLVHGGNSTNRNLDPYYATVTAYAYNVTGNAAEKPQYISGMTQFCGFCHNVLVKPEGSASTLSGTLIPRHGIPHKQEFPETKYRHATGVDLTYNGPDSVPVTVDPTIYPTEGTPRTVSCITCHFAHGTVSPANYQTNFPTRGTDGSMLLRSKSTSICMDCHPK